jgi:ribonuclease HI
MGKRYAPQLVRQDAASCELPPGFWKIVPGKCNIKTMKNTQKPFVEIYADGACSGNPGVGGFGAILKSGEKLREISGCDPETTNNRMELMGVISALEALKKPCSVRVTTDSTYVMKGMTEWIGTWIRNNWRNSQKKEVLNRDLWERLLRATETHEVDWSWIKGHNGHIENERCDFLAREEIKRCKKSSGAMAHEKA